MSENAPGRRLRAGFLLVLFFTLALASAPAACRAQQESAPAGKPAPGGEVEAASPRRVFSMEEIEILGQIEKPKTMFVIPKALHRYYWESEEKDFTPEILAPISRQEIEDRQRWRDSVVVP